MRIKRDYKREKWMSEFENIVITARPEKAGKLDWNGAIYHYYEGHTPQYAAKFQIEN